MSKVAKRITLQDLLENRELFKTVTLEVCDQKCDPQICQDCYYERMGEEIERHPIGPVRGRR